MRPTTIGTSAGPVEVADIGEGPAVIIAHGMPGDWSQVAPLGRELATENRVLLVSRPGYGSTPVGTGPTWQDTAVAWTALLDELGIERASIMGVSGGGPSSFVFASEHRDRCAGLILCCAVHPDVRDVPVMLRVLYGLPVVREVLVALANRREVKALDDPDALLAAAMREANEEERERLEADPVAVEWLLDFVHHHARVTRDMRGFRHDLGLLVAHQRSGLPMQWREGPRVPTLVLQGDADEVVTHANAERYRDMIPGAELTTFAGAGHAFLLTFRQESTPMLREFLHASAVA